MMHRRTFIKSTLAASLASSATMNAFALAENNPYRKNIGIQLYTLRNQIAQDTAGTIQAVAEAGYQQVEPYGFPNADDMIKASKDNGMSVHSSHFAWESVTNPTKDGVVPFDDILQKAKNHGLTHLVIPYLHNHEREKLDDYKRMCHLMNLAAAKAKTAGIQLSYHNHNFEFAPLQANGKTGYDVMVDEFSEDMQFEVDVFWVKLGGIDPVDLMKRLEGRVSQLHLKDLKKGISAPQYETGVPKDAFKELGNGSIDMEPIIEAAWVAGVDHCHVEQDQSPDPMASVRTSMRYLAGL